MVTIPTVSRDPLAKPPAQGRAARALGPVGSLACPGLPAGGTVHFLLSCVRFSPSAQRVLSVVHDAGGPGSACPSPYEKQPCVLQLFTPTDEVVHSPAGLSWRLCGPWPVPWSAMGSCVVRYVGQLGRAEETLRGWPFLPPPAPSEACTHPPPPRPAWSGELQPVWWLSGSPLCSRRRHRVLT